MSLMPTLYKWACLSSDKWNNSGTTGWHRLEQLGSTARLDHSPLPCHQCLWVVIFTKLTLEVTLFIPGVDLRIDETKCLTKNVQWRFRVLNLGLSGQWNTYLTLLHSIFFKVEESVRNYQGVFIFSLTILAISSSARSWTLIVHLPYSLEHMFRIRDYTCLASLASQLMATSSQALTFQSAANQNQALQGSLSLCPHFRWVVQ